MERKHRHIVETGLTLLAQAGIPFTYWTNAFSTAVHLIDRLPTPALQHRSPFEAIYHAKPDYNFLRIFGRLCYMYLRPYNCHKIQFHSSPGVFLGYSLRYKGYKCLYSSGKIYISRQVVFDEFQFPFKENIHLFTHSVTWNLTYHVIFLFVSLPAMVPTLLTIFLHLLLIH